MNTITKEDFDKKVSRLISSIKEKEKCQASIKLFEENNVKPNPPRVTDLEEWNIYVAYHNWYAERKQRLMDADHDAQEEYEEATRDLYNLLPEGVWFKYEDKDTKKIYAVGMAYSSWGGHHYFVRVMSWAAALPDLKERSIRD